MQGREKREIPEKTRRPAVSSSTISTCENLNEVIREGANCCERPEWGGNHLEGLRETIMENRNQDGCWLKPGDTYRSRDTPKATVQNDPAVVYHRHPQYEGEPDTPTSLKMPRTEELCEEYLLVGRRRSDECEYIWAAVMEAAYLTRHGTGESERQGRHWHAHQLPHRHYARSTKLARKLFVEPFFLWDFKRREWTIGEYGAALECKGGGNGRSPRKSADTAASSGVIPTCEYPSVAPQGIETVSLRREASSLATTPPRPLLTCCWRVTFFCRRVRKS
ncbi:hypothetical protein PR048_029316 [Dryococelus australis]|uniref:Uncharacterized protein n=1 Tax=Dryococelus australis TaxID=614101 RepID=A0ABQ9GD14_9NEOP|nr:hypothetical protein PR048_029316 [Dryococelus australis]